MKRSSILWLAVSSALFVLNTASAAPLVYPAQGRSAEQQEQDKYQCYLWAKDQTGVDPTQPVEAAPAPSLQRGGAVRGAAVGATAGTVGAAIGGGPARK